MIISLVSYCLRLEEEKHKNAENFKFRNGFLNAPKFIL